MIQHSYWTWPCSLLIYLLEIVVFQGLCEFTRRHYISTLTMTNPPLLDVFFPFKHQSISLFPHFLLLKFPSIFSPLTTSLGFFAQVQRLQLHHIQHQHRRAQGRGSQGRRRGAATEEMTRGERGAQVNDTWSRNWSDLGLVEHVFDLPVQNCRMWRWYGDYWRFTMEKLAFQFSPAKSELLRYEPTIFAWNNGIVDLENIVFLSKKVGLWIWD